MTHRRNAAALILWASALMLGVWPLTAGAQTGRFLIVNSDSTVSKYRSAQSTFKHTVATSTVVVDLGGDAMNERQLKALVRREDPDVIYCIGTRAYLSMRKAAGGRTIVVSSALNWERLPLSRETYGIASELSPAMQLTMFRYLLPEVRTIGVMYSKNFQSETVREARAAAADLGITLEFKSVKSQIDVERSLRSVLEGVDALWLLPDPVVLGDLKAMQRIFEQCDRLKKPILAYDAVFARAGAVLTVAPDVPTIGRQAARLAEQLVLGKRLEARFQTPAGSEVIINLKKAREYGLAISDDALDSVNEFIE